MSTDSDSQSTSTSTSASTSSSQSTGPTTFVFTASQVAYMQQELEEYRNLTGLVAKRKLATDVAAVLLNDIHEISGVKPSEQRKALLEEAVLQWFEDNGKTDIKAPKRVWASRWNARLVFNALHTGIVKYVAKRIYHKKSIPDLRHLYDNEIAFLANGAHWDVEGEGDADGDVEDEGIAGSPKKTASKGKGKGKEKENGNGQGQGQNTYFVRYQEAITLFWSVLTSEEIQKYEDLCAKWKEIGPPRSEQRRAASKHLHTRLYDFAEAALRDCGAVVHFLVGFEDIDGIRRAYDVECKVGPSDVPDFQPEARKVMEKSGFSLMWGRHVDKILNGLYGAPGVETEQTPVPRRQFGKPIIAMDIDDDGYPILPPLTAKPAHMQYQEWISCVLRSFFARHWAIARTGKALPPTTCRASSVQWKGVRTLWTECVDEEILPESMKELFVEPSDATLAMKEKLFNALYSRQEDPKVSQTFAFKALPVKAKGQWESTPIARRVDTGTISSTAGPSTKKKKKKKTQKKQVSFEKTISLKDNRQPAPDSTASSTPTSSEVSQSLSTTTSSESSSTATSSEDSGSSSTTTSSENSPSSSTATSSEDSGNSSSTSTSSEGPPSHSSSSTTSSDETPKVRRKKISFPTLKDLETPLAPAASSSSEDETLLTLLNSAPEEDGSEPTRVKRRRMEVPPVDDAALKTPRLTRAERAKLEAATRVSTRSSGRGNQGASGSNSRGGGANGGARGKKRGTKR